MQGQDQNFTCKILVNLDKTVGFEGKFMKKSYCPGTTEF